MTKHPLAKLYVVRKVCDSWNFFFSEIPTIAHLFSGLLRHHCKSCDVAIQPSKVPKACKSACVGSDSA